MYRPNSTGRLLAIALLSLAYWLLAACGNEGAGLGPLEDDAVILAFGDSLTRGTGAGAGGDYPSRLAALTGRTVINAGESGELSAAGRERLPALLARHAPDLVILWHGGNDILTNVDPAETSENLRAMVRMSRDAGARVLLLAVPAKSLFLGSAAFYARVAEELDVPLLDEVLPDVLRNPDLKADPIHPNDAGYEVIAKKIHDVLR